MTPVTLEQLVGLAPQAKSTYLDAFACADTVLGRYAINTTALRLAHFMAQVLHETGGLLVKVESMNYRAERIVEVWPSRFPTVAAAEPYAHNPEALANKVYGGRMGNARLGEGWRFIGRGLLQLTGRESYERIGERLGLDLANKPDLAYDPRYALDIAASEFVELGALVPADADDLVGVTRKVNGGTVGLANRRIWLAKTKSVWPA